MKDFKEIFNKSCIISPKRDQRPFIGEKDTTCPFCLENSSQLERSILEIWDEDKLYMKVVPNKYPITCDNYTPGVHDVIIDTESHTLSPKDFTTKHWHQLMRGLKKRWDDITDDNDIQFIQIFKNFGVNAGASISHSHWQIIALKEIPYTVLQSFKNYKDDGCYLCNNIDKGITIYEDDYFTVWVPSIPEFVYEVWIVPKLHHSNYGEFQDEELDKLGDNLKRVLEAYDIIEPGAAYNIGFITGDVKHKYDYHFYVRIVMRRGNIAGFELATNCRILSISQEEYANLLKRAIISLEQ